MEVRVLFEVINRFIHYLRKFFNVCMIYRAVIGHLSLRTSLLHNIRPFSEELNVVFRQYVSLDQTCMIKSLSNVAAHSNNLFMYSLPGNS